MSNSLRGQVAWGSEASVLIKHWVLWLFCLVLGLSCVGPSAELAGVLGLPRPADSMTPVGLGPACVWRRVTQPCVLGKTGRE